MLPSGDRELVQIMDAAFSDAARRAGPWLVCHPGCTQCCHGAFAINALDLARLHAGMDQLRTGDPALAATLQARAQTWIDEHGPAFPGDLQTGLLGESDANQEAFEEFANDAACPALDPVSGRCDLYAYRPMTCRVFGPPVRMGEGEELGCCELCFHGATDEQIAACEMPIPHQLEDSLVEELKPSGATVVAFALLPRPQSGPR